MLHGNYGVRTKPPGRSCERQTDGKYILVRTLVCGTPILLCTVPYITNGNKQIVINTV